MSFISQTNVEQIAEKLKREGTAIITGIPFPSMVDMLRIQIQAYLKGEVGWRALGNAYNSAYEFTYNAPAVKGSAVSKTIVNKIDVPEYGLRLVFKDDGWDVFDINNRNIGRFFKSLHMTGWAIDLPRSMIIVDEMVLLSNLYNEKLKYLI